MNMPQTYIEHSVATAGPAQLILALYDGLLASIRRAQSALASEQQGAPEQAHRELVRGQNIVTELQVALNREQGGALATSLDSLYDYCLHQLVEANITKNGSTLDAVAHIVMVVRDSWEQACCTSSST